MASGIPHDPFGALFEKMPTYAEIKAGTPAKALLSGILRMTETEMSATMDGQIQLGLVGGPGVPVLKLDSEELIADLELLCARMIDLGFECRDGAVYLEDLDGKL